MPESALFYRMVGRGTGPGFRKSGRILFIMKSQLAENNVLIIAEAGVNHNGRIDLAMELIRVAKECRADIVKFQTWVTDELLAKDAPKAKYQEENDASSSQYEMLKKLELSY